LDFGLGLGLELVNNVTFAFIVKLAQVFLRLFLRLSLWLSLALSGSLRLTQALSGSLRLLLSDFDFDSEPGADIKFGLPPPTTHPLNFS